jgi:hypothetical protein
MNDHETEPWALRKRILPEQPASAWLMRWGHVHWRLLLGGLFVALAIAGLLAGDVFETHHFGSSL